MDFEAEFNILSSEFYTLQNEFYSFKTNTENSLSNIYDSDSIEYRLNDLKSKLYELEYEFNNRLSQLPVQQTLNVYYLEHKENYDNEFYSLEELVKFLKENIFKTQDSFLRINSYSIEYSINTTLNGKDIYFQYSYLQAKDFLIRVSCFDESITGSSYKYCINTQELIRILKEELFNLTMTN